MSYRLINANALAMSCKEVNDMPCIYADLPNGLDGGHYTMTDGVVECEVSYSQDGVPRCSRCCNVLYDEYKREDCGIKNYCDECGAKVRKAVKR